MGARMDIILPDDHPSLPRRSGLSRLESGFANALPGSRSSPCTPERVKWPCPPRARSVRPSASSLRGVAARSPWATHRTSLRTLTSRASHLPFHSLLMTRLSPGATPIAYVRPTRSVQQRPIASDVGPRSNDLCTPSSFSSDPSASPESRGHERALTMDDLQQHRSLGRSLCLLVAY
ncbi:hypothetical protein B0H12DRAFT_478485 [Mycena haematopus]|nr:hypothetical protein B0H12DRAFT_478485 [Mycena haematopus]